MKKKRIHDTMVMMACEQFALTFFVTFTTSNKVKEVLIFALRIQKDIWKFFINCFFTRLFIKVNFPPDNRKYLKMYKYFGSYNDC